MQGKMNKSIALKLNKEIQKIQKAPNVKFKSQAQKKAAMMKTIDPKEEDDEGDEEKSNTDSLLFDKSIEGSDDIKGDKYAQKSQRRKNNTVTKVKDLLRQSNENALNINDKDLNKMFKLELPIIEKGNEVADRTS